MIYTASPRPPLQSANSFPAPSAFPYTTPYTPAGSVIYSTSSASPSPMRMPGMPTPQDSAPKTPVKVAKQATTVIQNRLTTLLGKRPSEEDEEVVQVPKKVQAHDSRLGKRLKPLQRTSVRRPSVL